MSPEAIISVLARLNELLNKKYDEQKMAQHKFKRLQMALFVLSSSFCFVLFIIYNPPMGQLFFILFGFNILFFIGFKPRAIYSEKRVKSMMKKVLSLQLTLKKYIMGEEVSFDGVVCSSKEGWKFDKWGLYKDNERIDYGEFLYDKYIKGLYLEALRNKKGS